MSSDRRSVSGATTVRRETKTRPVPLLSGVVPRLKGPVTFLSWGTVGGRPSDIARAINGIAWTYRPSILEGRRWTPLRWLVQGAATAGYLVGKRPRAIIATNPPIWLGLIAYGYSRLAKAPLVLDSHPGGFGAQEDRVAARVQALHRWLARRVAAVLVTGEPWATLVQSWGGRSITLWEAPVPWSVPRLSPRGHGEPLRILYVGVFGDDEPVAMFVDAMNRMDGIDVRITGDLRRAPRGLVDSAAAHVKFIGYLRGTDYPAAVADADLIVTMTSEPTSVMRAGCEAVWARRPLLVSDWPATRTAFPFAIHTANAVDELVDAVSALRDDPTAAVAQLDPAWQAQADAWATQMTALENALGSRQHDAA